MSQLLSLKSKLGQKKRKRIGRGNGSGHGTYATKGGKGQTERSGGTRRPGFEGGQTPLLRKMPKLKGFKNPSHVEYQAVNVGKLNIFNEDEEINIDTLFAKRLIANKNKPVKLLGDGELKKAVTVTVHKASKEAMKKLEAAKAKVTLLENNK